MSNLNLHKLSIAMVYFLPLTQDYEIERNYVNKYFATHALTEFLTFNKTNKPNKQNLETPYKERTKK